MQKLHHVSEEIATPPRSSLENAGYDWANYAMTLVNDVSVYLESMEDPELKDLQETSLANKAWGTIPSGHWLR